mmetsp:Transcript_61044/g.175868  ORF Transcript_61044/g.175868 Transcript_61044/m.175868 type:complete len:136 (+) Transcript_61044:101-508(+)
MIVTALGPHLLDTRLALDSAAAYIGRHASGAAGGKVILLTLGLIVVVGAASLLAFYMVKQYYEKQEALALERAAAVQPPSGTRAPCVVCMEIGSVVALVPCGHTLCRGCASQVVGGPCPSCRRRTSGTTDGLFVP